VPLLRCRTRGRFTSLVKPVAEAHQTTTSCRAVPDLMVEDLATGDTYVDREERIDQMPALDG
jgi:hypothetical protein